MPDPYFFTIAVIAVLIVGLSNMPFSHHDNSLKASVGA